MILPRGHIVLVSLIFFGVFSAITSTFATSLVSSAKNAREASEDAEALHLAEAGIDRAIAALNANASYAGESDVALGSGTFTISVTSAGNEKVITSTGHVPNDTDPRAQKSVRITAGIDTSVASFHYGVQAGAGGFSLTGGATINGNVYANGDINATSGVSITGSAVSATPPAAYVDQANEVPSSIPSCTSTTCITFGNTNGTEDFAQKFRLSSSVRANSLSVYLKKVGSPGDLTVRVVADNAGSPSTTVLLSGTLSASAVGTSFDWETATLPASPVLLANKDYWFVLDGASNASRYYIIGANDNGYANGNANIGRYTASWNALSPSTLDGYFRFSLGGGSSLLGGDTNQTGVYVGSEGGSATADTAMGVTAYGPLFCTMSSSTNKACDTTYSAPYQPMPLIDAQIEAWKEEAEAGGVSTGDETYGSAGGTLGPKKIVGNLAVNGGGTLTIAGIVWVTGTITVNGGGKVRLASAYGTQSGAIISDGIISLGGGSDFAGSGTAGSYPFLITTSACPNDAGCGGASAITLSGGAGAVALIAQNGTATINGGAALKAITAQTIAMGGGASLTYDSGLISTEFFSGSGGSWAFIPGTYSIVP
jgi:hypothetical protein